MPQPRVILYSKPTCHLCDEAAEILTALAPEISFTWDLVNIELDASLFERYRYKIPVLEVEGGPTLTWPTTRERVRRALADVGAVR